MGTGVSLLFLTADNEYIGNLANRNLNLLPLCNLENGENTIIDLSQLTLYGTSVVPSHDPFGNEILITDEELKSLRSVDGYYESMARNLDTNKDSIPDILSETHLFLYSVFLAGSCGHWGLNDIAPVIGDSSSIKIGFQFEVMGGANLSIKDDITLSGPTGDPYDDIHTKVWGNSPPGQNFGFQATFIRNPDGTMELPFRKGDCTINMNGKTYFVTFANIDVYSNFVLGVPTIYTDDEGIVKSISIEYRLLDGTLLSSVSNILTEVGMHISNKYNHELYGNDRIPYSEGFSEIVPEVDIYLATIASINIGYKDLLGNHYTIHWE